MEHTLFREGGDVQWTVPLDKSPSPSKTDSTFSPFLSLCLSLSYLIPGVCFPCISVSVHVYLLHGGIFEGKFSDPSHSLGSGV